MSTPELVEVTQDDREMAADQFRYLGAEMRAMRDGLMDDDGTVQAFARHRLAAIEATGVRALQGLDWTIKHQNVAKALVGAVQNCGLWPGDDEDVLTLYDIIPEEWCAPDRSSAVDLIAENIAFSALHAWMAEVRSTLSRIQGEQS